MARVRAGAHALGEFQRDAVFLLKTAIPLMALLLLLQGMSIAIHSLLQLLGVEQASGEAVDQEL